MRLTLIVLSAALIAASAAQASPRFSGQASSSLGATSHRAQADVPLLFSVMRFFGVELSMTAPAPDHGADVEVCEEGKKAETDKRKKKSSGSAGPEPVLLAF